MKDLHVIVSNKIATYLSRDGSIVCGNTDYQIVFTFDSEWDVHAERVARFIWNNKYCDVPFTGDTVAVPPVSGTTQLTVGVYAGELSTTTAAQIPCLLSILCKQGQPGAEMEAAGVTATELNDLRDSVAALIDHWIMTEEEIAAVVTDYLVKNPLITEEDKEEIAALVLAEFPVYDGEVVEE